MQHEARGVTPPDVNGSGVSALARSTVVATLSVTADGVVVDANRKMCSLLGASGLEELAGRQLKGDLLADAAAWRSWQQARTGGFCGGVSLKLKRLRGGTVELAGDIHSASNVPDARSWSLSGVFIHVTAERRLRSAMKRGARVEALAALTSGTAHDVNNLLTVLVGNLYLVAEEVRQQPALLKKVKAARDAAKRGSELTRRLLSFARNESVEAAVTAPAKVIGGVLPLLRRALGRGIVLETSVENGAGTVRANAAELESAIVNLTINARDAIDGGGKVTIAVSNRAISEEEARARGVPAGEYLAVSVSDDGVGIPPDALERVFEPFFSTKKDRGGTGLGMSMVRWFTEQAGGGVHIESRLGEGTTVTMLLPRATDRLAETASKTMPLSTLPGGSEKILMLVTDEALRATMSQMLEVLGYTVQLSRTAGETIDRLRESRTDLIVIDATSADGLSVPALLRRAATLAPGVKALVATSGAETFVGRKLGVPLLLKPFSLFDFATTVRRALDGAGNV